MRARAAAFLLFCLVFWPQFTPAQDILTARVVAVGIRGASAVAPVGFFHPGGPIRDKPEFAAFTQPGRVLDPKRVLVASNSNYGAPLAQADAAEGAILSLDPDGETIVVSSNFATAGNQATALDGRLQLFTAQSPAFLNAVRTPGAASAAHPTVSNPLGISINNAFGRLWFSNSPRGVSGVGTESIADPTGEPLANAPSKLLGGVFAGDITNRPQQIVPGALKTGAVATALLGMSPDGSKRAVFAVLASDGSIAQAHTEFALDGLAPAGTVAPIPIAAPGDPNADQAAVTRTGMIFNWVPNRVLYVAEPGRNAVTALTLTADDKVFRLQAAKSFDPPELAVPIDLAPAVPEVANPGFASNTTLAGNADIYVANRGNGTIVRMKQDGTIVGVRRIVLPDGRELGNGRLNGIAVSPDAQKIWVTVTGALPSFPDAPGALLELPAFAGTRAALQAPRFAFVDSASEETIARGAALFAREFAPAQGLGPLFNASSCLECHKSPTPGGAGANGLAVVSRVGRLDGLSFDALAGRGGPVARTHSIAEYGHDCNLAHGPPVTANLISIRNAPALYGLGLIEAAPDDVIRAGIRNGGRVHIVRDAQGNERVGRFGWKADVASLEQFVAEAFRNELGITSPLAPFDLVHSTNCGAVAPGLEDDGSMVREVTAYISSLPPPLTFVRPQHRFGQILFAAVGCGSCHTPSLAGERGPLLYSDLLLHDMGPAFDDRVVQGEANGRDWRTTPLWGMAARTRFLHDGRALSVREAILAHDGEAAAAVKLFRQLTREEQEALIEFVRAI
jgi:mono/diheme cytochrome c family protein